MMRFLALFSFFVVVNAVGPVQKVIEVLDNLHAEVTADGEIEQEQFAKYQQWCADEEDASEDSITQGEGEKEGLEATIEELAGDLATISSEVEELGTAIAANEQDLSAARDIRKKESGDFEATNNELIETIDMLTRADRVLRKQLMLVQQKKGKLRSVDNLKANMQVVVQSLAVIVEAAKIGLNDKKKLAAMLETVESQSDDDDFLDRSAPKAKAYESHSGEILDVLADLKKKAEKEQLELQKKEMQARHNFEMLQQSLTTEVGNQKDHLGELKKQQATDQEAKGTASRDLAQTTKTLSEDKKYLHELYQVCKQKQTEFEARRLERVDELKALAEAKRVLTSDDAQAAFKAQLSGEKLLQLHAQNRSPLDERKSRAATFLSGVAEKMHSIGLSQLASRFRDGADPFGKVKGMIEHMIQRLMEEEVNEADHKQWCDTETAKSKGKLSKHSASVDNLSARVDQAQSGLQKTKQLIARLQKEVAEMNKGEAESTSQRNSEKAESKKASKEYADGQLALQQAIDVLRNYYPSGGRSFAQVRAHVSQPKFGGPVFSGSYQSKVDGSGGVINMLEVALSELARGEAELHASEDQAQRNYDNLIQANKVARATKTTEIEGKTQEVKQLQTTLDQNTADRRSSQQELDAVLKYLDELKGSCVHQPMSFEERRNRRGQEIEALHSALAILSGEEEA